MNESCIFNVKYDFDHDSVAAVVENGTTYLHANNGTHPLFEPSDDPYIPLYIYILVSVFNAAIFILGIFGNFLVILVIVRVRNMRTPTNFFLLNLSIADILVLLICQPAALMEFFAKDRWFIGEAMCKLVPLLENGALSVSIMTMMAVTAERYNAICHPFKRNLSCTLSLTNKTIVIIWIVGFVLASPFLIMTHIEDANFYDGSPIKVCRTRITDMFGYIYTLLLFVVLFVLPFFILTLMYSKIIRQLSSDTLRLYTRNDHSAVNTLRSRKQVVRMLIVIIVLFFVSLCPIRVMTLWLIFTPTEKVTSIGLEAFLNLISFARIMMYLNSACNPLVYSLTSTKFKLAFKMVLNRQRPQWNSFASRASMKNHDIMIRKDYTITQPTKPCLVVRLLFSIQQDSPKTCAKSPSQQHEMKDFEPKTKFQNFSSSDGV